MSKTSDVFGVATKLRPDTYVDRGNLDSTLQRFLSRDVHLALRGSSKSGKSWLRQKMIPDAIVVQCRFGHSVIDLYRLALNELGLTLEVSSASSAAFQGQISPATAHGAQLLRSVTSELRGGEASEDPLASDAAVAAINDLELIACLINKSGRRLVIEDFHYLAIAERKWFASDLKAFWEYGLYVVIIGIWSQNNMLLHFNPDLGVRLREESIAWSEAELQKVLAEGALKLNIEFSPSILTQLAADCYGNVGILQALALAILDELDILESPSGLTIVGDQDALNSAAMEYSEQLVPTFQTFASNVATGIRKRKNSTAIYAHAIAAVLEQSDADLLAGVKLDRIYEVAHARESRIQKGNLRLALANIEALQVDEQRRGLVLGFNPSNADVTVVDRDILFFRKYQTVSWPWEDLVRESAGSVGAPEAES